MAISLTYIGDPKYTEIAEATRMAHDFLQGQDIIRIIKTTRDKPFDDTKPSDLAIYMRGGFE